MAKMDPGQASVVSECLINIVGIATAIENHDTGAPPNDATRSGKKGAKPTQHPAEDEDEGLRLKKESAEGKEGEEAEAKEGEPPAAIISAEEGAALVNAIRQITASGDMVKLTEMVEAIVNDCLDMVEVPPAADDEGGATRSSKSGGHKKGR